MPISRTIFLTLGLLGLLGCNTQSTPPPILIGHVSDKTRLDQAGDQAERGIRLALHELTQEDGLADAFGGRLLQVRHTDTRGQLDAFESQAVRLDSVNRCLTLFGGLDAPEVTALDHIKVPLLTFHGHPVSGASNQVFYLGMMPTRQGAVLAKVVADHVKAQRLILLVDERRPERAALVESFLQSLTEARQQAKVEPVSTVTLRFGKDPKWNEWVARIQTYQPQVVLFAGAAADFNAWHKAYRKELPRHDAQLIFAGPDGESRLFDFENDAKVTVLLATAFHADPASDKMAVFAKAYREAFQVEADVHAALAHDGFRLLVEAMKRANPQLASERLREELLKTKDFAGLTGPLTITPTRQVERTLFVVRWQNSALTLLKKVAAGEN